MKIYVITKGEYSDYHICAVATDPVKADQLAEFYSSKYDKAYVEEFDTEAVPGFTKGMSSFKVRFDKRGDVVLIYEYPECWNDKIMLHADCSVDVSVQANSEEDAKKIGAEKRAKFLAEKMGL